MITILESQVKLTMSLPELRVLRRTLGTCSNAGLKDQGMTDAEVIAFGQIYRALSAFLDEKEITC